MFFENDDSGRKCKFRVCDNLMDGYFRFWYQETNDGYQNIYGCIENTKTGICSLLQLHQFWFVKEF